MSVKHRVAKGAALRDTGISVLGSMPWSTHFALFYETQADLADALVPYFAAGLAANERCLWLPSKPSLEAKVKQLLRKRVPDFDARVAQGDIRFIPARHWYRATGGFDAKAVRAKWDEALKDAERNGYEGLRGSGDLFWVTKWGWSSFSAYEKSLHRSLQNRRGMIACTIPLDNRRAADVLDSIDNHHLVLSRHRGKWQVVETATLRKTKEEIERANMELEERIAERTREIARSQAKLARARRAAREAALQAEFRAALDERSRLAREIHDSLLQGLTGIALQLRATVPRLEGAPPPAVDAIRTVVDLADQTSREARQAVMDMRAPSLVEAGLPAALEEAVRRTAAGLHVDFAVEGRRRALAPDVEDTIFRVGQEAVLNAVRHAGAGRIRVRLDYTPGRASLTVEDDGRGFPVEEAFRSYGGRWGLLGMRERADRIGASLVIDSRAGEGTTITLRAVARRRPAQVKRRAG